MGERPPDNVFRLDDFRRRKARQEPLPVEGDPHLLSKDSLEVAAARPVEPHHEAPRDWFIRLEQEGVPIVNAMANFRQLNDHEVAGQASQERVAFWIAEMRNESLEALSRRMIELSVSDMQSHPGYWTVLRRLFVEQFRARVRAFETEKGPERTDR